jgi:hypothetical protein
MCGCVCLHIRSLEILKCTVQKKESFAVNKTKYQTWVHRFSKNVGFFMQCSWDCINFMLKKVLCFIPVPLTTGFTVLWNRTSKNGVQHHSYVMQGPFIQWRELECLNQVWILFSVTGVNNSYKIKIKEHSYKMRKKEMVAS